MKKLFVFLIFTIAALNICYPQNEILVLFSNENSGENYPLGLPVKDDSLNFSICISQNEKIKKSIGSHSFLFSLSDDTLSLNYKNLDTIIQGKFFIPSIPEVTYIQSVDPETFKSTIVPKYFFEPIKVGKWLYAKSNNRYYKSYDTVFDDKPKPSNCIMYKSPRRMKHR